MDWQGLVGPSGGVGAVIVALIALWKARIAGKAKESVDNRTVGIAEVRSALAAQDEVLGTMRAEVTRLNAQVKAQGDQIVGLQTENYRLRRENGILRARVEEIENGHG